MAGGDYVPNELLSRLVGDRMYSVEFVLNDYVQLRFDGEPGSAEPVTLSCYVWPRVDVGGRVWTKDDPEYADALVRLAPGTVRSTSERTGSGIGISLDTGALIVHPEHDEVHVEIAEITGFSDRAWMIWRPGEDSFEDLIRPVR
ncbi:hypothetical protein [Acidipropionibacterium virtanenii]|uniref:Uncharacterized protein n=1 Tax=Acidipropionibacterium virtanenii TaxID=2057246 RepID=A0A344UVV7_9ACTN|nr:hypothetical protein [Acidipropionibacterium virtanenii]AXE39405.1 hypothetical protein JS278_02253 [Acidipropionibacterium virtanenii]